MKTYTEEQVKNLLVKFSHEVDERYRGCTRNNIEAFNLYDEVVANFEQWISGTKTEQEITLPFLFWQLDRVIDWGVLCDIINVDYYKKSQVKETEQFNIKESTAKEYGLI